MPPDVMAAAPEVTRRAPTSAEAGPRPDHRRPVVHLVPAPFDADDGIIGGAERYVLELARHMAEVTPTRLVSFGRTPRQYRLGALDVRIVGPTRYIRGSRTNPIAAGFLRELVHAGIVHCHQQHVVASSLAAIIGLVTRRPVFVTDLGGGGWDLSSYVSTDGLYRGHLHISRYSQVVAGHADRSNARVVLGGVDAAKFHPGTGVERSSVLFVGRLLPHKGVDYLVEALPPGMRLEVIGRPHDRAYLTHLQQLAHGRDVIFRLEVDDAQLRTAYQRALCVVLPSVYVDRYGHHTDVPELLGQTLLEGMACGAPGICTSVASLPEVVVDRHTGLIVPPNDSSALRRAIEWMRDHRAAAGQMGEASRRRALDVFSWPAVVQRCLDAYAR